MHGQQWQGYKCYQAGGMCALRTFDPMGQAYIDSPYVNFCQTENASDPCELTFYGLDPAKEYYFAICSHFLYSFSPRTLIHANVIAVPEIKEAADIKKDGFTAVWSPVTKADNYEVTLYGVNQVQEDTDSFIIFEEDFDNVSAFTDATDINNPTILTEDRASHSTTSPRHPAGRAPSTISCSWRERSASMTGTITSPLPNSMFPAATG